MNHRNALKYIQYQMAAEAFLGKLMESPDTNEKVNLQTALQAGNQAHTLMPASEYRAFIAENLVRATLTNPDDLDDSANDSARTTLVAYHGNDATGLAFTVFQDPDGSYVLSVRSTEAAETIRDYADMGANGNIARYGFAYAQIASLDRFFQQQRAAGAAWTLGPLTVTGYSLGANVASGFALLHPGTVSTMYLYNGAGFGEITTDQGAHLDQGAALRDIVNRLQALPDSAGYFTSADGDSHVTNGDTLYDQPFYQDFLRQTFSAAGGYNAVGSAKLFLRDLDNTSYPIPGVEVHDILGQDTHSLVATSGYRAGTGRESVFINPQGVGSALPTIPGYFLDNFFRDGQTNNPLTKLGNLLFDYFGPGHSLMLVNRSLIVFSLLENTMTPNSGSDGLSSSAARNILAAFGTSNDSGAGQCALVNDIATLLGKVALDYTAPPLATDDNTLFQTAQSIEQWFSVHPNMRLSPTCLYTTAALKSRCDNDKGALYCVAQQSQFILTGLDTLSSATTDYRQAIDSSLYQNDAFISDSVDAVRALQIAHFRGDGQRYTATSPAPFPDPEYGMTSPAASDRVVGGSSGSGFTTDTISFVKGGREFVRQDLNGEAGSSVDNFNDVYYWGDNTQPSAESLDNAGIDHLYGSRQGGSLRGGNKSNLLVSAGGATTLVESQGKDVMYAVSGDDVDVSNGSGTGTLYLNNDQLSGGTWDADLNGWVSPDRSLVYQRVPVGVDGWRLTIRKLSGVTGQPEGDVLLTLDGFRPAQFTEAELTPTSFATHTPWLGMTFRPSDTPPTEHFTVADAVWQGLFGQAPHTLAFDSALHPDWWGSGLTVNEGTVVALDDVHSFDKDLKLSYVVNDYSGSWYTDKSTQLTVYLDDPAVGRVSFKDFTASANVHIDSLQFADGVSWSYAEILSKLGLAGDTTDYRPPRQQAVDISDASTPDGATVAGGVLEVSGAGVDNLYRIGRLSSRAVTIRNFSGNAFSADRLQFGDDLTAREVVATRVDDDLVVFLPEKGSSVTLNNYFSFVNDPSTLKPLQFADGSTLGYDELAAGTAGLAAPGTAMALWAQARFYRVPGTDRLKMDFTSVEPLLDQLLAANPSAGLTVLTEFVAALRRYPGDGLGELALFREHYLAQNKDYAWAIDNAQNLVEHFDNNYGGFDAQPWLVHPASGDVSGYGDYWNTLVYGADGHVNFTSRTESGQFLAVAGDKDSTLVAYNGEILSTVPSFNSLDGGQGDDCLVGGTATNFLDGHGGNDLLQGGAGANTYFISAANGNAVIRNVRNTSDARVDVIQFDADVSSAEVAFYRQGDDLLITRLGGGQTLVEGYFAPLDANGNTHGVAQITFADGTLLTPQDLSRLATPLDGASHVLVAPDDAPGVSLQAWEDGSTLVGGSGSDRLAGSRGDDVLVAGSGTTRMAGHGGRNTYVVGLTSGDAVLDNTAYFGNATDVLRFVDGLTPADLAFSPQGNDLVLKIKPTGHTLTVKDFYAAPYGGNLIASVEFAAGTTWSRNDLAAWLSTATDDSPVAYAMAGPADAYGNLHYVAQAASSGDTLYGQANPTGSSSLVGGTQLTTFYGVAGQHTHVYEGSGDSEIFTHPEGVPGATNGFLGVTPGVNGNTLVHTQAGDGVVYLANFVDRPGQRLRVSVGGNLLPQNAQVGTGNGYDLFYIWDNALMLDFIQTTYGQLPVNNNANQDPDELVRFSNGLIWDKSYTVATRTQRVGTDVQGEMAQLVADSSTAAVFAGDGDDTLSAQRADAWLFGGGGNDTFFGQTNTLFSGGWGHNTMYAGTGLSTIDGGLGGADIYLNWNTGSRALILVDNHAGNDNVWLGQGSTTVRFDFGVTASDVDFVAEPDNSLKMVLNDTGQYVDIQNWFDPWNAHQLNVEFLDGTTLNYDQITAMLPGNGAEGDVTIHANDSATVLQAGSGNDTLYSSYNGTETIFGGPGKDTVYVQGGTHEIRAGSGATTIVVNASSEGQTFDFGYGNSTVHLTNNNGQQPKDDVLKLDTGITQADVSVSLVSHYTPASAFGDPMVTAPVYTGDLKLTLNNGASFVLDNAVTAGQAWVNPIDTVQFSDGTSWTFRDLLSRVELHPGADGNIEVPAGMNLVLADGSNSPVLGNGESAGMFSYYSGSYLKAGTGAENVLEADKGFDILQGGSGMNYLTSQGGYVDMTTWQYVVQPSLLDGGTGNSVIMAGDAVVLGDKGNSVIQLWGSNDTILYNKGDGSDSLSLWGGSTTLSLGGGLNWNDVSLEKSGQNLVIDFGDGSGKMAIQGWYDGWMNTSGVNLQLFTNLAEEGTGTTPLAQLLNLGEVAAAFDAAQLLNPALTEWNLGAALQQFMLTNEQGVAMGGDIAHYYALEGTLSGMSVSAAQACLAGATSGSAQTLHSLDSLQASNPKILP